MYFDPAVSMRPAPFTRSPFKSLIVPRPIGWISTISKDGIGNLAPYSFFNGIAEDPPMVQFCPNGSHVEGGAKDSLQNVEDTGEFVFNMVGYELTEAMNISSGPVPKNQDEMELAGLAAAPCEVVKAPRVRDAAASFECKHLQTVQLPSGQNGSENSLVIGQVVGIHVRDDVITEDGLVDVLKIQPLARLGYMDYTVVNEKFTLHRPT